MFVVARCVHSSGVGKDEAARGTSTSWRYTL